MKKFNRNFTNPEQSKRLLELGVPALTSDFFYPTKKSDMPIIIVDIKVGCNLKYAIPCWSVGRLIEIMKICNHPDDVDQVFCELAYSKKNLVELIVRLMEENKEITDFSKLEGM